MTRARTTQRREAAALARRGAGRLALWTCVGILALPEPVVHGPGTPHLPSFNTTGLVAVHILAPAHAGGRRDKGDRPERDSGASSRGAKPASAVSAPASPASPAAATAMPGTQRSGDSNDRFASEARTPGADAGAARPGARTALPEAVRNMTSSRAARRDGERSGSPIRPNREIVVIRPDARTLARAHTMGFGVTARSTGRRSSIARLAVPDGLDVVTARDMLLRELPNQRFGVNHIYRSYRAATESWIDDRTQPAAADPCPPDRCFGPSAIRWRTPLSTCAQGMRIGVIDTAVDFSHPAFAKKRFVTRAFAANPSAKVTSAHGTGVLALLAANERTGTPGLVPAAEFFVADVFSTDAAGQPITDTASLVEALDWMQTNNVRIINASVAGPSDEVLKEKILELARKGILVVAAAGNDGPAGKPVYPAAYPEVIAVTAVDRKMKGYRQANHGAYIDVAAPGVDIWTAIPNSREGFQTGTSFAVPYVTALAATLLMPGERAIKAEVLKRLQTMDLGPRGRDVIYGLGAAQAPTACASRAVASTAGWSTQVMRVMPAPGSRNNFSLAGGN